MLVTDKEVMTVAATTDDVATIARMTELLARQRRAHIEQGPPSARLRIDRLDRIKALLSDHRVEICDAMTADYIVRAPEQTMLADVVAVVDGVRHAKKHLHRWMKSSRRSPNFPAGLLGREGPRPAINRWEWSAISCRGISRSA